MSVTVIGNKLQVEVLADESTKTQLTELNVKYDDLDSRVDTILTTPVESVSAEEIIDARQGEVTLGANITKVKSQLEQKILNRNEKIHIVGIGDSLMAGTPEFQRDMPTWLGFELQRNVINKGIWGNTTSQVLGRLKEDVIDLKPEYCMVLVGTNDINSDISDDVIRNNIKDIIYELQSNNIKPVMLAIPPRTDNDKLLTIIKHNRWLNEYCKEKGILFVDTYTSLCSKQEADLTLKADVLLSDGLHLTAIGHRIQAKVIADVIKNNHSLNMPVITSGEVSTLVVNHRFILFESNGVALGWDKVYGTEPTALFSYEDIGYTEDLYRKYQVIEMPTQTELKSAGITATMGASLNWLEKYRFSFDLNVEGSYGETYGYIYFNFNDSLGATIETKKCLFGAELNAGISNRIYCDLIIPINTITTTIILNFSGKEFKVKISNVNINRITP